MFQRDDEIPNTTVAIGFQAPSWNATIAVSPVSIRPTLVASPVPPTKNRPIK